jgi:tRNA modification GTPase
MFNLYDDKPIIACSTGTVTNSAIGLIRLSGFESVLDFQQFFSLNLSNLKARYNHFTKILDNENVVDEVVISFYPGPNSFNGENILEISAHGNQLNIQRIIKLFVEARIVRAAKPGEFSYRALKNKKLSLTQVEGLDLLLNANSSYMLEQGLDILQGDLHAKYSELHDSFLKLKSSVEISIDFADDVGDENCTKLLNESLTNFSKIINQLHKRIQSDMSDLTAPSVSLVGQTNAGKSSLFNILLDTDRSIVSDIAGTTRDYVSEFLSIDGNNFRLIDTAGVRETTDSIEKIGIEKAIDINSKSFFKILVINPLQTSADDFKKLSIDHFDLVVFSHLDRAKYSDLSSIVKMVPQAELLMFADFSVGGGSFELLGSIGANGEIGSIGADVIGSIGPVELIGPMGAGKDGSIGAKFKSGSIGAGNELEELITRLVLRKFNKLTEDRPLLVSRHRDSVNEIYLEFVRFQENIRNINDIAIISSEVNILGTKISELVGILSPDDVLNNIFSNFCIGK